MIGAITGISLSIGFALSGKDGAGQRSFADQFDNLAVQAGLGINQVSLTGHRVTADNDVFDALKLDELRSMARFSIAGARARIEALPWVAEASLARVFPDELRVIIKERQPFALWRTDDSVDLLIDATGHVLGAVGRGAARHLPLVTGKAGARRVKDVIALLAPFPKISGAVTAYERVGDRRWTLRLPAPTGGEIAILLPENEPGQALARLARLDDNTQILKRDLQVIDLRNANRLTLRPFGPARPDRQWPGGPF